MNKKESLKLTLAIALLTGSALSVISCKDDDDDNNENKKTEQKVVTPEMIAQKDAVECVLMNLAGVEPQDTMGFNLEGQRFEPTIGKVRDESQPSERAVLVDDEVEASLKFRALVANEDFVKETSDGYVIDLTDMNYRLDGRKQKLGTLTYHRASDGTCMGYAEVDIPCVPLLRRISYVTKDQWGSNGWDEYGNWESPCYIGQVWLNASEGLYYLCVVESKSDTDGWLINVQPGRSNMYTIVASNEGNKGAWGAKHPVSKAAVEGFVKFCIDGKYYDMKQAIRKRYPGKVFPPVPKTHGKGQTCSWDSWPIPSNGDDGFGTSQKGYGHWVGGTHNESTWYSPGDGPEVLIIRDGWEGSYAWSPPRHYRHQEVYCMAPRARYDSSRYWYKKTYVYHVFENSDYCDWMNQKFPYTANGYSFRATPPSGFGSTPVFDPADEGF